MSEGTLTLAVVLLALIVAILAVVVGGLLVSHVDLPL